MRAKMPNEEGVVDRDGVFIHYEVYGNGPQIMVFVPPWSITHSRVYKAQLPYFSERFRCATYDGRSKTLENVYNPVTEFTFDNTYEGHDRTSRNIARRILLGDYAVFEFEKRIDEILAAGGAV